MEAPPGSICVPWKRSSNHSPVCSPVITHLLLKVEGSTQSVPGCCACSAGMTQAPLALKSFCLLWIYLLLVWCRRLPSVLTCCWKKPVEKILRRDIWNDLPKYKCCTESPRDLLAVRQRRSLLHHCADRLMIAALRKHFHLHFKSNGQECTGPLDE